MTDAGMTSCQPSGNSCPYTKAAYFFFYLLIFFYHRAFVTDGNLMQTEAVLQF